MKVMKKKVTTRRVQQASQAASLLGKRSWQARLERFGLSRLKEIAAKVGRANARRPKLPDDQVTPAALYQRARRARLKLQAAKVARKGSKKK